MKKRLLTVLLAVCLVVALGTVTAWAANDSGDFEVWSGGTLTDGNYKLENDVTVSDTIEINGNVVLDLNGWTVRAKGDPAFNIDDDGNLTICDSSSDGDGKITNTGSDTFQKVIEVYGTFVITGGTINNSGDHGYALYADYNASVEITDGTISNSGNFGYALRADMDASVEINGGTISNSGYNGNALYANSNALVIMNDGTISNSANNGEALYVNSNASAKLNGGEIINSGSGGYALDVNSNASAELNGATITNNFNNSGYAVSVYKNASFSMTAGTVTQNNSTGSSAAIYANNNAKSVSISGGNVESANYGVYALDVQVSVTGGTFNTKSCAFFTRKLDISPSSDEDVKVTSDTYLIYSLVDSDKYGNSDNKINGGTFDAPCVVIGDSPSRLEINGGVFNNLDAVQKETSKTTVVITGGTFKTGENKGCEDANKYIPDNIAMEVDPDSGEIVVSDDAVAVVNGVGYETLADAIEAASDNDTITLVDTVTAYSEISIDKSITIDGQGHKIILNAQQDSQALSIGNTTTRDIAVTFDNVDLTIKGTTGTGADAIDVWAGLNIYNSKVEISELRSAFVMQGGMDAKVNVNNSTVNVHDITGNGSNGGVVDIEGSEVSFTNIDSHALSIEELTVGNSTLNFEDVELCAIYGQKIDLNNGADVNIMDCGTRLPNTGYGRVKYVQPVQIKTVAGVTDNHLTIDNGASLSITGDKTGVYVPEGTDFTSNGTVNATVELGDEDMNLVTVINRDSTIMLLVADGDTYQLGNPGTYNGYTFGGWRSGNTVYKAGETVTITTNMTFTAIWNAINIPDTYDIEIADTANGEVSTSLSNASAGSTITITAEPDTGYSVGSVTVTGPDGRGDVTRLNATTYTFKMPEGDVTVRVTFTAGLPFTDVSANQWFYEAVSYVYTNGMMEGDSATTFNPDGQMTRAMFWAVLGRIDGANITGANWIDTARNWAMSKGVSDGTDPNGLVTREMMVTMLWRYAGEPASEESLSGYTDAASVSDWAAEAMSWALETGVIEGVTATTLQPQGTATRAQCATIFMRYDALVA